MHMFLNVAAAQSLYNTGARAFPGLCPTHTMANPAGPGAGSANAPGTASAPAPGTASARDLEQYTTHMLPSPPQTPPPIELRIHQILRQHTSQANSACRRHSSVIGQAPSLDELDEPDIANSWKHNSKLKEPGSASSWDRDWKAGFGAWHSDEGREDRQREQKDKRHWQTDGQVAEGWRRSPAWTSDWASGLPDGPGSASSRDRDWKSGFGAWQTDERREDRQREQKDNRHGQTDGQVAEGWRRSPAWTSDWASGLPDGPGSASSPRHDSESKGTDSESKGTANSWQHDSKVEVGAWHADERQEERQREQKDNRHWQTDGQVAEGWASGPFDGPGSASSQGHDSESKVCSDRSDDRKGSLQESMRKWADQASMREDKALDIARKSKAKRQREGGDTHRAWLDQKYLKRTLKRLR